MMLQDKKVCVLGGNGSIGSAIVKKFQDEGAQVFVHGKISGDYVGDFSNEAEAKKVIEKILTSSGGIDILVNALGAPIEPATFEEVSWKQFEGQLNIQLRGTVLASQILLPHMKKEGGSIITILTCHVDGDLPTHLSAYITAKYALLGLTKTMAKELARHGVTVNAISPGFIKNVFTEVMPGKVADIMRTKTPTGRLTTPEDVAGVAVFLASSAAAQITGENIVVDGGSTL